MKKEIHSDYHPKAQVTCVCGREFNAGSTKKSIEIEICSACHPFYTGQEKVMDTAGRVEKFKDRAKKAARANKKTKEKETTQATEEKVQES